MKDVLIVGATGFIGKHLISILKHTENIKMRVLIHKNGNIDCLSENNITLIDGDLMCPETLEKFCIAGSTLVNLAYLQGRSRQDNLTAINNLLDACEKVKIKRFIHCSTASVFGRVSTDIVTENTTCNPVSEYEITKMEVEKAVFKRASNMFEAIILRPTGVFGAFGKNLLKLSNDLRYGNKIANYFKSCLFSSRRMNLVSVNNVVSAIQLFIETQKKIDGEIFVVSDDEYLCNNYYYVEQYLTKSFGFGGYPIPVFPLPSFLIKVLLKLLNKTNYNPVRIYSPQKLLNFTSKKKVPFDDGLYDFCEWYKKSFYENIKR